MRGFLSEECWKVHPSSSYRALGHLDALLWQRSAAPMAPLGRPFSAFFLERYLKQVI